MTVPSIKYAKRKNTNDVYWSVYEIFSGSVVVINSKVADTLLEDEADVFLEMLNTLSLLSKGRA